MPRDNSSNNNTSNSNSSTNTNSQPKARLCCFGYVDYIVLASTLAVALGEELNSTDLNILATFLAVLSDELALIGAINSCPSSNNSTEEVFVPPVPDVAMTRSKKRTRVKKIVKRRIKKK
ncbi:MAG: hypothetical protein ACRCXA_14320 [Peptostreptococcaceae bacterium]